MITAWGHRLKPSPWHVASVALVVVLTAACSTDGTDGTDGPDPEPTIVAEPHVQDLVSALPQESIAAPPPLHLADGIVPPTNRWYSGLAFGEGEGIVFPGPLSVTVSDEQVSFGLPRVDATPDAIHGSAQPDVSFTVADAVGRPVVSHADPVAVGLEFRGAGGEAVAQMHLAAGWPVMAVTAEQPTELTLSVPFTALAGSGADAGGSERATHTATVHGVEFALVSQRATVHGDTVMIDSDGWVQWIPVPEGSSALEIADALGAPVTNAVTTFEHNADSSATLVNYRDADDTAQTLVAMPPWRAAQSSADCSWGGYSTINGPLVLCAAGDVRWDVASVDPTPALDLSGITDAEREAIVAALQDDAVLPSALPHDSYFGGKALYRIAQLWLLADALDEQKLADTLGDRLVEELRRWSQPEGCETRRDRCFVYDPAMRGVVGLDAAFGSDEFNDHHFHYGYFLLAAGIAGQHDPSVVDEIAPVMDLLAADLASPSGSSHFPERRVFDPVAGHSWASGTAPFTDGNNQESSSEAVAAWAGLSLWAEVREDDHVARTAQWMLSHEADAAMRLWLRPDLSEMPEYAHPIVSIQWGGKRDFGTWFSDDPAASLGIQLLPMVPAAHTSLAPATAADADRIRESVAHVTPEGLDVPFADYLLMYLALASEDDRANAWESARELPAGSIDDGNSRAYMLAWIASAPE